MTFSDVTNGANVVLPQLAEEENPSRKTQNNTRSKLFKVVVDIGHNIASVQAKYYGLYFTSVINDNTKTIACEIINIKDRILIDK